MTWHELCIFCSGSPTHCKISLVHNPTSHNCALSIKYLSSGLSRRTVLLHSGCTNQLLAMHTVQRNTSNRTSIFILHSRKEN